MPYEDRLSRFAAAALYEADWFTGRSSTDIGEVYYDVVGCTTGTCYLDLPDGRLALHFSGNVCTGTEVLPEG